MTKLERSSRLWIVMPLILVLLVGCSQSPMEQTRKAAEQGLAEAQVNLGNVYADGEGVPQDPAKAADWYRKAAEQGNASAQYSLSLMYGYGTGVPKDEAKAVEWIGQAAEQGNASAQYSLGLRYAGGRGVPKDESKAVEWHRKAAEQGDAMAKRMVDMIDRQKKEHLASFEQHRKAAERGDAEAQFELGKIYQSGKGVPKDIVAAIDWCRKAADQGHVEAMHQIGVIYGYEASVKDEAKAVEWTQQAAEQGFAAAQLRLVSGTSRAGAWRRTPIRESNCIGRQRTKEISSRSSSLPANTRPAKTCRRTLCELVAGPAWQLLLRLQKLLLLDLRHPPHMPRELSKIV